MKKLYFWGFWWLTIPHLLIYLMSPQKGKVKQDLCQWETRHKYDLRSSLGLFSFLSDRRLSLLSYLLLFRPEYRNVFYIRVGILKHLLFYLPPLKSLYINTPNSSIGGGLYIEHGFSTIINAERIGKNCWINQQVTIGSSTSNKIGNGIPIISDNVKIYTGAIVIGKITIGQNCIIGAGATVVRDVSPDTIVIPQKVICRKQMY